MNPEIDERFVALQEFVTAARERLDDQRWNYIVGAADTETSMRRNREALNAIALRPRVLNDVTQVQTGTELFGKPARLPVVLAPIGGLESFDPNGALSVAKAAEGFGVPMMISSVSKWSIEQLSEASNQQLSLIFQLYARDDAAGVDALVDRSLALNLPAFCITVDSAMYSRRERDITARFVKPWRADGEGSAAHFQAALNWDDIARIRQRLGKMPMILKGIATAQDALLAVDQGVDVIYVSNHGGRQLDHTAGTMTMLTEVVNAVNGRAQVMVDGGFCRGTDLVKALASGASAVGLGRMMCLALSAAGPEGVQRMLEILEEEFRIALALLGVTDMADLNSSFVESSTVSPLDHRHPLHSAFPLLGDFKF
jgi:glycolate oxidase